MRWRRDPRRGDPPWTLARWVALGLIVVAIAAWTTYLASASAQDGGPFAVIVRVMGSVGILYGVFLVFTPRRSGVLGLARVERAEDDAVIPPLEEVDDRRAGDQRTVIAMTLALAIGALMYRIFQDSYLHQTSAFFVGVPAILAVTLSLTPKAKSATGMIIKGLTLAVLLSGIVFAEGFICILMATPLFYLVGIAIGVPIDRARKRKRGEGRAYSMVGVAVLLMSIEGLAPMTSFPAHSSVEVTKIVRASAGEVRAALARAPSFDESLPFYLRLGFPRPVAAHGSGLDVGDTRTIIFGEESPMEPMGSHDSHGNAAERPNELELEIARRGPGLVVFKPVLDATVFTHWIDWGRSVVRWRAVSTDTTQVTWTFNYTRRLSPAWYFGPWQQYAARRATSYLIDTVATP